jgi:gentisate 1,2-dioxygenase
MNALRFVMEGAKGATIVDGKDCPMNTGDLVLTPAWTWHEHYHEGDSPIIWMDVLDVYLHIILGTDAFQPGPVSDQPPQVADACFEAPSIVPCVDLPARDYSPMFRYPWAQAWAAVQAAPVGPELARRVRYANPLNGGSAMSTLDCYLLHPQAGTPTRPFKSSASTVCCVAQGSGASQVGAKRIEWTKGDVFTLPQNLWASHTALSPDAAIFMVSDREIYRKLGLLEEHFQA